MNFLEFAAIGIVCALLIVTLKKNAPEIALVASIGAGVLLLVLVFDYVEDSFQIFRNIVEKTNLDISLLKAVIKIVAIGYVAEFANGICVDAGVKSVGDKVLFGGKVVILWLALPILTRLVNLIAGML